MTTAHTPTPWTYRKAFASHPTWHVEAHGTLASVYKEDNADHIVACVNAHDGLVGHVAELEAVLRRLADNGALKQRDDDERYVAIVKAEARAALARGQS
jgi:hypothetical protein